MEPDTRMCALMESWWLIRQAVCDRASSTWLRRGEVNNKEIYGTNRGQSYLNTLICLVLLAPVV